MSRDGIYHSACLVGRGEGILALEEPFITTGLVSSMNKTAKFIIPCPMKERFKTVHQVRGEK